MAINTDDLNKLAGKSSNVPQKVISSVTEGEQTIDKIKSIVEGVAGIFNKVESFKQQAQASKGQQPANQSPIVENVPQHAPIDMQSNKRATVKIDDEKLLGFIKTFSGNLPEPVKEMTLNDLLKQGEGNEQVVKSYLLKAIKEVVSVEYVE